jgi:hypothetical protein
MNQQLSQDCRVMWMSTLEEEEAIHLLMGLHGQLVQRLLIIIMRKNAPVVDVHFVVRWAFQSQQADRTTPETETE